MNQPQERFAYEFGDFRIDPQRRVLISRGRGEPVSVTGKVFDTLLYLVEHAGELLDKRTLLDALWPQVVVEEANLTQTIHTLRRVLGERPGEHRYIVTVPGRGYRFVANVTTCEIEEDHPPTAAETKTAAAPSSRRRIFAAAALVLVALATTTGLFLLRKSPPNTPQLSAATGQRTISLAVLPFVDMSSDQDQAYFADGLAEEILNLLAQSSSMRIIARTSSFSFKGRHDLDIETIASKLDATHVLEGSVRKSGRRLRVTAQLVDGATSAHLWSQTYDRDLTDIFSVQDEIAAAVTDALHTRLDSSRDLQADTTSEQAFEQYLNGRYFFNRRGESDVVRARNYFQKALKLDASYARAWAGLAATYHVTLNSGQPADADLQQAWRKAIEQGLSLGPGIAEVHVRAAQYYWWLGDWRTSDEHCKVAIALNPSDALVLGVSASKALVMGNLHEAIALQRRAVAVDPLSAPNHANLGMFLAVAGELDEAEAELKHAKELSPTLFMIDSGIAGVLVLQRRFDESLALVEQLPAGPIRDHGLAIVHYASGNIRAADAAFAALTAQAEAPDADPTLKVRVAEVHALRGDKEQALQAIEQVLASQGEQQAAMWARFEVLSSPFFGSLRDHARWQPLVASAD